MLSLYTGSHGRNCDGVSRRDFIGAGALGLGGLKMGQVIGQSTRDGAQPATEPLKPRHLMATILHTLFDVRQLRFETGLPQELRNAIDNAEPIPQLF